MATKFVSSRVTIRVRRLDAGPDLVIEDADVIAERLFADETIARYDNACGVEPARFVKRDIELLAWPMMVRGAAGRYASLLSAAPPIGFVESLGADRDLLSIADPDERLDAIRAITHATEALKGAMPYVAGATKLLHLKRPSLVPILDSLILSQLGVRGESLHEVLEHFTEVGVGNRKALDAIRVKLAVNGRDRSPVRILEGILWATHPAASGRLDAGVWEMVIRRRPEATSA